ncbi:PREDICTED: protein hinderin, partial [Nanorana parkeri]|uniref:protein hinderin n=1 Tax=Nanorana parkeri TaxID=125878 RepID=UPI000854D12E
MVHGGWEACVTQGQAEILSAYKGSLTSCPDSDEDQHMAYVPGLCTEGNLRPASKFKNRKPEERKSGAAAPIPEATMDLIPDWTQHRDMQGARGEAGSRSASLKDLCPEDKRRIANLIKELARVSEEKEVTEERLKTEHESFEKKIRHLEEQNKLIATEREAQQQQYRECQEMLSLYQKYLSEQQDKLSRSLSDLGAGSVQPHQVPKINRQPKEKELNGSYLAPRNKQSSELESLCSVAAHPCCRTDPASGCGFHCHPDGYPLDSCARRKCCSSDIADLHYPDVTHGHHCSSALDQPLSHCCWHRPAQSARARGPTELSLTRRPEDSSFSSLSATSGLSNGVVVRPKESAVSEQRKHELMLQKMELEVEKERLQQLLEQHEAKLLEKQQELLQTKMEPERNPLVIQTKDAAITTSPSLGAVPKSNGYLCSPMGPSSVGLPTPPSSNNSKKVRSLNGTHSGRKVAELNGNKSLILPQSSVSKDLIGGTDGNGPTQLALALERQSQLS